MRKVVIGFRAQPDQITFAVLEENIEEINIKILDKVNVPKAFTKPEQLKFIRSTFLDILDENKVELACIRATEPTSKNINIERISIEAIIQELIASSSVINYCIGTINTISARLGFECEKFKNYTEGTEVFNEITDWRAFSKLEKEALLAAFCALKLNN